MAEEPEGGDAEGASPAPPPKFVYECVRCGHSCADRNFIEVTLEDVGTWTEDQTLASLYPYLRMAAVGRPYLDIVLASDEGIRAMEEGRDEPAGCPLYDAENRLCNIYHSMPLTCRAYPLAWNGSNFYVRDRECQGLGQGHMTQETLEAHRDAARAEFDARRRTNMLMPALQGIITRYFVEASVRAMESLSEEDRRKLEDLISRGSSDEGKGED